MKSAGIFIICIFFFYSCGKVNKSKDKNIIGAWEIIYISENDGRELPKGVFIEFYDNGTFISKNNDDDEIASGIWEMDRNNSVLLLEGEDDIADISEWNLKIAGYTMSWVGTKNSNTANIELKFAKITGSQ